jgi:uncharacterized protein (TIGR02646 family)
VRYIDLDLLEQSLTQEWKDKAEKAYAYVKNLPAGKERNKAINNRSHIWSELKETLKRHAHEKCWYCESSAHRIMGDIDHHRPKNKVEQCPDHPGYWWLAFNWRNYRYCCERCNRLDTDHSTGKVGGKHTHFPLWDETKRVYDECDLDDLRLEAPLLLDPTEPDDPLLLTFDLDGTARPACDQQQCPQDYQRAVTSIELYHLNHTDLKKRRQFEVCYEVSELVKRVDKYLLKWQNDRSNIDARIIYVEATKKLKKMICERAEYSAAARAALKTFRKANRLWVDELLTAS